MRGWGRKGKTTSLARARRCSLKRSMHRTDGLIYATEYRGAARSAGMALHFTFPPTSCRSVTPAEPPALAARLVSCCRQLRSCAGAYAPNALLKFILVLDCSLGSCWLHQTLATRGDLRARHIERATPALHGVRQFGLDPPQRCRASAPAVTPAGNPPLRRSLYLRRSATDGPQGVTHGAAPAAGEPPVAEHLDHHAGSQRRCSTAAPASATALRLAAPGDPAATAYTAGLKMDGTSGESADTAGRWEAWLQLLQTDEMRSQGGGGACDSGAP
jgi:hypothetical protein